MPEYKKVPIKQFPAEEKDSSPYWSQFKQQVVISEIAQINHLHYHNQTLASSASTTVKLYTNSRLSKTISRFKDVAYSARIRNDGKLLIAGDNSGIIQLFDLSSRAILRTLRGHKGPVRVTKFSTNNQQVLSASDDNTVRLWDIASESCINQFDHTDHVRTACMGIDPHLILSGSYDHTIKLWDTRSNIAVFSMDHIAPIESVLFMPGGGMLCSAGGNRIKMWDMKAGLLHSIAPHSKTITDLAIDSTNSYLLSGSLDRQLKVTSLETYNVEHSIKYPAPILAIAISVPTI
jgi:U3 small nucleolar RNA-associated protein 15